MHSASSLVSPPLGMAAMLQDSILNAALFFLFSQSSRHLMLVRNVLSFSRGFGLKMAREGFGWRERKPGAESQVLGIEATSRHPPSPKQAGHSPGLPGP